MKGEKKKENGQWRIHIRVGKGYKGLDQNRILVLYYWYEVDKPEKVEDLKKKLGTLGIPKWEKVVFSKFSFLK